MIGEVKPEMPDVICLLLFAVEPSDQALEGWGIGQRAAIALREIAGVRQPVTADDAQPAA
jgi:hypothetical protein